MYSFKPTGYNSVSPYFIVDGAQKMINLLTSIFNAKELRRYDQPDGSIMHAELQIDDSVIMLADSTREYPSNQLLIHVYVADVHAVFKKAIDSGCEAIEAPVQKGEDPDVRGQFKDFSGNIWAVGTQRSN